MGITPSDLSDADKEWLVGSGTTALIRHFGKLLGSRSLKQLPFNGSRVVFYVGEDASFNVQARSLVSTPEIVPVSTKISDTVYQYVLTGEASVSGVTGTAVITATLTIKPEGVTLISELVLKKFGVALFTGVMRTTPGLPIPPAEGMIFVCDTMVGDYSGSVTWKISASNYLAPSATYSIAEPVVTKGSTSRIENPNALLTVSPGVLKIYQNTTSYGADVMEVVITLKSNLKQYPGQYPRELIGKLNGVLAISADTQPFLKQVDFRPVMRGYGCYVLEKTASIRERFDIPESLLTFYEQICDYMAVRYALSGLIWEEWDEKWLLGRYYNSFLINLAASEFSSLLPWFQPGGIYYGFQVYMLEVFRTC